MARYIELDALVAEIERIEQETNYEPFTDEVFGKRNVCKHIKDFINTLVKEVDLEEDINDFINEEYHYEEYEGKWVDEKDWRDSIQRCSKHFFVLGLKAQKGE